MIFTVFHRSQCLSIKGVADSFSEDLLPIPFMPKNPDDIHGLNGFVNKVEDNGRIKYLLQNQLLSVVDSRPCVHPKIPFKRFSLSINLIIEVVGPFSSKAKFNIIRYVRKFSKFCRNKLR